MTPPPATDTASTGTQPAGDGTSTDAATTTADASTDGSADATTDAKPVEPAPAPEPEDPRIAEDSDV